MCVCVCERQRETEKGETAKIGKTDGKKETGRRDTKSDICLQRVVVQSDCQKKRCKTDWGAGHCPMLSAAGTFITQISTCENLGFWGTY